MLPTTSNPRSTSSAAATDESTPPDMPTRTFGGTTAGAGLPDVAGTVRVLTAGQHSPPGASRTRAGERGGSPSGGWGRVFPEGPVKPARCVQLRRVFRATVCRWRFPSPNPDCVELPCPVRSLPPLPVGLVVVVALLIGWLVGWAPTRLALWRRGRELR